MKPSQPPQTGRRVAVALFEDEARARAAVAAVQRQGVDEARLGLLSPAVAAPSASGGALPLEPRSTSGSLLTAYGSADLLTVLTDLGVPDGEARYYSDELGGGQTVVVVAAFEDYAAVRGTLIEHGGRDVQSVGAELIRSDVAPATAGSVPQPVDLTDRWEDVISRYETLWQQHYGTTDQTWEHMAPIYRYAWEAANDPARRGRPWPEVESAVRADWEQRHPAQSWDAVAGAIHDVWDDVAEEAALGAEGGQDRRVARPF